MKRIAIALLFPLATFAAAACDDAGGGGGLAADATTSAPDDTTSSAEDDSSPTATPDTGPANTTAPEPDTTPADTGSEDPQGCDRNGFTTVSSTFDKESGSLVARMRNEAGEILQIEIYNFGSYDGAVDVGTYPLAGTNYADCANCVVVRADCQGSTCSKRFYADEGDLVITEWEHAGGRFAGWLDGVKAREVTINSSTYESTPVAGGETWCLDEVTFDATIPTLPVSDRTQPECVSGGTGNIVGDNVASIFLTNCEGRRVKLHGTCGDPTKKALWLIGTTGWCTACHEFLEGFVADHGGYLSRERVNEVSEGLDMLIILGENQYGTEPTPEYCMAYAEELGIDPAMVLIDWSDEPAPLPIVNAPGMSVETNSLATLWTAMDPYLYAVGGSVATYYPWWALLRPYNMEYVWSDRGALQSFEYTLLNLLAAD